MVTGARKARLNPRPARARSKQSRSGWSQAPRPGSLRSGSGTTSPSTLAKRRSAACGAALRQPTHRRSGLPDDVGVLALERLVRLEAAVARAGQGGIGAAAAVGEDRAAAAAQLLLLAVAGLLLLLGALRLGADVAPPAREPGGEPGVLALAADRQRQLVVGHDHRGLLV